MNDIYLGRAIHTDKNWAKLEPLARLAGGRWEFVNDGASVFRPDGKVFYPSPLPRWATKDSMWVFTVRENDKHLSGRDEFIAVDPSAALPIIDLTDLSLEQARERLFEEGVPLPHTDNFATIILLAGGLYCRLDLPRRRDGVHTAEPSTAAIPAYAAPSSWVDLQALDGFRYFPGHQVAAQPVIRRLGWWSDQDFVERVLNRYRRLHQNVSGYAGPTKDAIHYIARALRQGELLSKGDEDQDIDMERLTRRWPLIEERFRASDEFMELIRSSEAAKEAIDLAVKAAKEELEERLRAELEPQVRQELESLLKDAVDERDNAAREAARLQHEVANHRNQLSSLREQADSARQRADHASSKLAEFLRQLRTSVQHVYLHTTGGVLDLVRALESALGEATDAPPYLLPPALAPWNFDAAGGEAKTIEIAELPARLRVEADAHALDESVLRLLDVFTRAGEVALLIGPNAGSALMAYARCVSAASIYSLSVDASTIGLDDLWRTPGTLQPTALAYAWNEARSEPASLRLVCIRNVHSAPSRLWLPSLQEAVAGRAWPRNLLVVATMEDPRVTNDTSDQAFSELTRRVVPMRPTTSAGSGRSGLRVAFMTAESSTRLACANAACETSDLPVDWAMLLASASGTSQEVARAARVAATAARTYGEEFSFTLRPWAQVVVNGDAKSLATLPKALAEGYAALKRFETRDGY